METGLDILDLLLGPDCSCDEMKEILIVVLGYVDCAMAASELGRLSLSIVLCRDNLCQIPREFL